MHLNLDVEKRHPAVYAAFLCLTLSPLYYLSWLYHTRYPYNQPASLGRPPSTDFVADWLDTYVVEPFNPSAIGAYCNQTEWNPNLIFRLDNANGGIGNVRGNILDFVFFALEAGASIMLPDMASRSDSDISNVWGGRAAFDLYFDEAWFLDALHLSCPQMEVYKVKADQKMAEAIGKYLPRSRRMDETVDGDGAQNTKVGYLEHFNQWLTNQPGYKADGLALVDTERTLWDVDTRSLPLGFRHSFSQLLRVNPTVRRLAALIVQNLATKHEVDVDPRDGIPPQAFYGAHLRTEVDARNAGWLNAPNSNFSAQTDAYIDSALKNDLRVMYVATGDAGDLARFKLKAATHRPAVNITSKLDLLPPHDLETLKSLTWDQQALVDYEVLQHCSVFGGFVKSSFSYNIAMTRSEWGDQMGRVVDPWRVLHTEGSVAFDDGLSRIIGRDGWHEHRIPRGMWP